MSRIGKTPITLPSGVEFACSGGVATVKGPRGELSQRVPREIDFALDGDTLTVRRPSDTGRHRALHGLTRSLVANMVEGVTNGFTKRLEIVGVGYRAAVKDKKLELQLGFSHPVVITPPDHVEFETPQPTIVLVKGIDKQVVGQVAADIRRLRPPEPYKGKGVRYAGEYVQRKVGKRA